ncbi:hypothetical protein Val02_07760 [Virgisporangium aliadipatigenens]|uniref:DUF742 domain-containing protein n=1 Tax=Virgisporangium aliadipatigenens TaxID=741659 RepID=A0A8J3YH37_9ACTN|nr:DUF742 domain-containing protein [Virgisporangium aliadipatigenens]GIJ43890.1 hypothetical protein Val02_07760 [Virgisporangium aliadipatigenens]
MSIPPEGGGAPRIRPFLSGAPARPPAPSQHVEPVPQAGQAALRPFILTGGRVNADSADIKLETQVTARPGAPPHLVAAMAPESQHILHLCQSPLSVAEISARLHLHLGVIKILVADLHHAGYLDLHAFETDPVFDPDTILRVINGLRAIH